MEPSSAEAIFAQIEALEVLRIDPEIKKIFDMVPEVQRQIDEGADPEPLLANLNACWPHMNEPVSVTGRLFGPRRVANDSIEVQTQGVNEERVRSLGFDVRSLPVDSGNGEQHMTSPRVVALFKRPSERYNSGSVPLAVREFHLYAAAFVDEIHITTSHLSSTYAESIARDMTPEHTAELEAIVAASDSLGDALINLKSMNVPPPKSKYQQEAMRVLKIHAYNLLNIDEALPYSIVTNGCYFDEYADSNAKRRKDNGLHVETEHHIGDIVELKLLPLPIVHGDLVELSKEYHWAVRIKRYGDTPADDIGEFMTVPVRHISSVVSVRDLLTQTSS